MLCLSGFCEIVDLFRKTAFREDVIKNGYQIPHNLIIGLINERDHAMNLQFQGALLEAACSSSAFIKTV